MQFRKIALYYAVLTTYNPPDKAERKSKMISLEQQMAILKDLTVRTDKINKKNKNINIHVDYDSGLKFITIFTPHEIFILNANDPAFFKKRLEYANYYLEPLEKDIK